MTQEPLVVRVVRGRPSAEELAALVAVLAAVSSSAAPEPRPERRWAAPATTLRAPAYGRPAGGWRASGLPR